MRSRGRWVRGAAVLVGLSLLALSPAPPGSATARPAAARPAAATRAPLPVLTWLKARHTNGVDRVVFGFSGGVPGSVQPTWVDTLHHDGSGLPVRVAGEKVLMLVMHGVVAHDQGAPTTRLRTAFSLPNVITAVQAGDFEATVTFGLGVQQQTSYQVTTKSDRVVVDVAAAFPTTRRAVYFVDEDAFATGHEPYVRAVQRPLRSAAPATAALHALFAGPTPLEQADGLRLVRSRAWGFDDLRIADGIARLRLTKACSSGGSTLTVAAEIMPTLKQFPTVDWVKIYGPGGHTENPTGASDSIPVCLEP